MERVGALTEVPSTWLSLEDGKPRCSGLGAGRKRACRGREASGGAAARDVWLPSQVDSEEPVFEAVLTWVKHAGKEREESLPELLQHVRMPLLTPRYITDVVDAEVRPGRVPCSPQFTRAPAASPGSGEGGAGQSPGGCPASQPLTRMKICG